MKTQCERLLRALELRPMTEQQIRDQLGIRRAAARVHDLRKAGYLIASDTVTVRNRFGETCRVAKYTLAAICHVAAA